MEDHCHTLWKLFFFLPPVQQEETTISKFNPDVFCGFYLQHATLRALSLVSSSLEKYLCDKNNVVSLNWIETIQEQVLFVIKAI